MGWPAQSAGKAHYEFRSEFHFVTGSSAGQIRGACDALNQGSNVLSGVPLGWAFPHSHPLTIMVSFQPSPSPTSSHSSASPAVSSPPPLLQTVEVLLRDTTVLPEGDSSSMCPFDKDQPSPSPSQLSSKDSPQGELQFPPGFQLDLTCTVMHLDAAHPVPSPAPINSVVYSSKFGL